jgi:hypothetical protein
MRFETIQNYDDLRPKGRGLKLAVQGEMCDERKGGTTF